MKHFALLVLLAGTAAHADVLLDEYGAGGTSTARPAQQLVEAACEINVDVRGAVAVIETRERLANPGPLTLAASVRFALPRGAQLIGATLGHDAAIGVPVGFASKLADQPDVLGVDPALVEAIGDDHYQALLQPIAPNHDVTLITRSTVIAEIHGGALHLALPAHGTESQLAPCRGTLRATPGPGAKLGKVRIAGTQAAGVPATFTLGATAVAIDIELAIAGSEPLLWTQTEKLGDGFAATLATVVAPPLRAKTGAKHALFVIDGSRSMELVGRDRVAQVMRAVAGALPSDTEIDAIVFDRTAARVLGVFRPGTPETLAALAAAIQNHVATNGSDIAAAFALAHRALADVRGPTIVIAISDGVIGDAAGATLQHALDGKTSTLDVHAIVLDPARTRSPGIDALRAPVNLYGGTVVEVATDEIDHALGAVEDWLRPGFLELHLGAAEIPAEVRAGAGFTVSIIHRDGLAPTALTGHGETAFRAAAHAAPAAPIAQLALATTNADPFATDANDARALAKAEQLRTKLRALHPAVDETRALAVLAQTGKVAANRRAMVAGGGSYERSVALADPPSNAPAPTPPSTAPPPSAIARLTLERLFRDQLAPRAYACYQRALGTSPKLVGTAYFELHMGRGEVSQVTLSGLGDKTFDACLLDAAYALQPPLPDFAVNADDQTIARYPLSFSVRDDHPLIMPGDADSSSPIDIEAVQGGVPDQHKPIKVETATPLGNLRPH